MIHGTGLQRVWYDNGQVQLELSTVLGEFTGRSRSWLADGTLLSDQVYLRGRFATVEEYRAAAKQDRLLPSLGKTVRSIRPLAEKKIHQVHVSTLLSKPNQAEARSWLENSGLEGRQLGRFKSKPLRFVAALYDAGATEVIASDLYSNKSGDQFSDSLLVRLPQSSAKRRTIRSVAVALHKRRLGAIQPVKDIGESHLYLSMS